MAALAVGVDTEIDFPMGEIRACANPPLKVVTAVLQSNVTDEAAEMSTTYRRAHESCERAQLESVPEDRARLAQLRYLV